MKKHTVLFILLFLISSGIAYSQTPGQWTWMHGDSTLGHKGNFGIKGVTNAANYPPSLYSVAAWTDQQGNFWIYGGSVSSSAFNGTYGDLWKHDPIANTWTWMTGSGTITTPPVYGTQGVPSASNTPGSRTWGMCSWTDNNGDLWMFGGWDNVNSGELNDLWRYNIATNMWTWMSGSNMVKAVGNYGTLGIASSSNIPSARRENTTAWMDNAGDLWMFGGWDDAGYFLNDLWRYNISTNQWTWMNGSNIGNASGVYGTKGVSAPGNQLGSRWSYSHWKDKSGNFWLLGGCDYHAVYMNDLWEYNVMTNMWTWIGGSNTGYDPGNYVSLCDTTKPNYPGSRYENRACWTDCSGNFWMMGGGAIDSTRIYQGVLNDLWQYNPVTNNWRWVNGSYALFASGNYGTQGVSNANNSPSGRIGALSSIDKNGYLWLFGGKNIDSLSNYTSVGDLWRFVPDPSCGGSSCALGAPPTAVFISSDTTFCNESGECIDFFDHSTGNPMAWKWTFPGATPDTSTAQNPAGICYYTPGTYPVTLIISNAFGSDTMTVSPLIIFGSGAIAPSLTLKGDTIFCSHASAYQWYINGSPITGATDSFYIAKGPGNYSVMITDAIGCSRLSSGIWADVKDLKGNNGGIQVYPNPAGNELSVISYGLWVGKKAMLEINNVLGENVYRTQLTTQNIQPSTVIDVSALSSGVYFIRTANENHDWNGRFIKK